MDILTGFGSDLFSGHRIIRVKSWDDWKKLQIPSNCELMGIDEDPDKNYLYMKRSNGLLSEFRAEMDKKDMTEADHKMYKEILDAYAEGITKLESMKKAYWAI